MLFPWLICRFRLPSQLILVPPTSIDLEPKELYNASHCAYIISVQPFPRREGNYAWATFSALAVSLDNRSVETLTGRSPYYLSLMLHTHVLQGTLVWRSSYSLHSNCRLISEYIIYHGLRRRKSSPTEFTLSKVRRRPDQCNSTIACLQELKFPCEESKPDCYSGHI
jgi:hypothetical protein